MRAKRISAASGHAKPQFPRTGWKFNENRPKRTRKRSKNANDHEQQARVHPAQPSYSVVVPAPELSSVNVAVGSYIAMIAVIRKGLLR